MNSANAAGLTCTSHNMKVVVAFVGPYNGGYAVAYRFGDWRMRYLDFVEVDILRPEV